MDESSRLGPANLDAMLEEITVDACGDREELSALCAALVEAMDFPLDVFVIGEPVTLMDVTYGGNPRRGLVARCRLRDGSEQLVGLADVSLPVDAKGAAYLGVYRRWLGLEPYGDPSGRSPAGRRRHKAEENDVDLSRPVDLVALAVKERAVRCRLLGKDRIITLRSDVWRVAEGQILTVRPRKQWRFSGHPYLSGEIEGVRIDAKALGLVPLALNPCGSWDPSEEYWGEDGEPVPEWAEAIIACGPRGLFEMEQVLPDQDPEDFDSDPILEANDRNASGDIGGAQEMLSKLLEADLRCLDAHAHLGNIEFAASPKSSLNHYEVGVRIGELSLGDEFDDVLSWGLINNRPFLRCMVGYGLCLWRLERFDEAERVFERMLWMNPSDNQGIRALLPDVRAREPWTDTDD